MTPDELIEALARLGDATLEEIGERAGVSALDLPSGSASRKQRAAALVSAAEPIEPLLGELRRRYPSRAWVLEPTPRVTPPVPNHPTATLTDRLSRLPPSMLDRLARQVGVSPAELPAGSASNRERADALVARLSENPSALLKGVQALFPTLAEGLTPAPRPWWAFPLTPGPRWARLALRALQDERLLADATLYHQPETREAVTLHLPSPPGQLRAAFGMHSPGGAVEALSLGRALGAALDAGLRARLADRGVTALLLSTTPETDDAQRVPWEGLVLPPETGTCAWRLTPTGAVLRELAGASARPPPPSETPCALLAWAEPRDAVGVEPHEAALLEALGDRGPLERLPNATAQRLAERLRQLAAEGRPARVVHLLAHGGLVERDVGGLILGSSAHTQPTHAEALGAALAKAPPPALLSVFACQSPRVGDGPFGPLLATLGRRAGVPVIGSQAALGKAAATQAARALYARLFSDGGLVEGLRDAAVAAEANGGEGAALVGLTPAP